MRINKNLQLGMIAVLFLTGCQTLQLTDTTDPEPIGVSETSQPTTRNPIRDFSRSPAATSQAEVRHGSGVGWSVRNLTPIGDPEAEGTMRRMSDKTMYTFKTQIEGLPDPGPNGFYEVWLVKDAPPAGEPSMIWAGKLKEDIVPGVYHLTYQREGRPTGYSRVWITRESLDDGKPERQVMEGQF